MASRHEEERKRVERARRDLNRVAGESDTLGSSAAARMATRIESRFKASDVDPADPVELWGTRIGRGLGLIAFAALSIHLLVTYVLN